MAPAGSTLVGAAELGLARRRVELIHTRNPHIPLADPCAAEAYAMEPMHGWAIAQRIRRMSNDVLQVGQSALYPALHKLEQQGWIEAEWKMSESNRRAKYYALTRAGRKAMANEAVQWERLSTEISLIVRTA